MIHLNVYFDERISKSLQEKILEMVQESFPKLVLRSYVAKLLSPITYNSYREQFNADLILRVLEDKSRDLFFLGIVSEDIYIEGLNYVFGLAKLRKGAIVSTFRLCFMADDDLFHTRLKKTIKHELGHVFGLMHCKNACVMRYANSLEELDAKPRDFCDNCNNHLKVLGVL